jgi:gas vesicle structural protein
MAAAQGGYLERPKPSGLADVIEVILDKGLVIDAYVRISLIGIELITIDARIVIASVDTYLRFAEAGQPARPRRGWRRGLARAAGDRAAAGLQGGHQRRDRGCQGEPGHRQIGRHPRARLA